MNPPVAETIAIDVYALKLQVVTRATIEPMDSLLLQEHSNSQPIIAVFYISHARRLSWEFQWYLQQDIMAKIVCIVGN